MLSDERGEIVDVLIDATDIPEAAYDQVSAAASEIADLAGRMSQRMADNAAGRGDWRADNPARAAMRSPILRAAADKLVRLFCQAFDGHDRDGLVEAIEEQAADVANWAWLVARAAIDAAERRKG